MKLGLSGLSFQKAEHSWSIPPVRWNFFFSREIWRGKLFKGIESCQGGICGHAIDPMAGQVISKLAKINSLWWLKRYSIRWSKGSSASELTSGAGWTCPVPVIPLSGSYLDGWRRAAASLWWDAPWHSWPTDALKTELRSMPVWRQWPTHGSEVTRTDDTMQVAVMMSRIPPDFLRISLDQCWAQNFHLEGAWGSHLVGRWIVCEIVQSLMWY